MFVKNQNQMFFYQPIKQVWQPFLVLTAVFFIFWLMPGMALAADDTDLDGLSDEAEINIYNTDPNLADTDGDSFNDYIEIYNGYSPRHKENLRLSSLDSDSDKVPDSWEIRIGTNLAKADTDEDGYDDQFEIINGYDPISKESKKIAKLIKVDLKKQELAYFFGESKLEEFKISSGIKSLPTPTGVFSIMDKVPSKNYGGRGYDFYYPNTKWNLHFYTKYYRYYIHGAYWHNKFGRPMSHGCVNVSYANMERLYNFAEVGTRVEIN